MEVSCQEKKVNFSGHGFCLVGALKIKGFILK